MSTERFSSQVCRTHAEVIARLQGLINRTLSPITRMNANQPFALLDFPDHANVGDSAIYTGELTWMRSTVGMPSKVSTCYVSWDRLDASLPNGPIYIHGGGNFGDIYHRHQIFREALLQRYPKRPIVQLPQSLHYDDPERIGRTARLIARHGAFTLLVRDKESQALAERHFDCQVQLCPDMAFGMGDIARPCPPTRDVLLLLRTDNERAYGTGRTTFPEGWVVTDWLVDEPGVYRKAVWSARTHVFRTGRMSDFGRSARELAYFDALAKGRVTRGVRLLGSACYVITDRLHAHILCTLMGIPHALLDNSYGKITRFSSAFDTLWNGVTRCSSIEEAIAAAEAFLSLSTTPDYPRQERLQRESGAQGELGTS